ncbi:MAG: MFS transporter [Alphaproteobacteria bacterium]
MSIAIDTRRELRAMGAIGLAHGCSHFFQLVLPPLFPFLVTDFDVGFTELGIVMTTFFVVSGFGQPVAGFIVDRLGARNVLVFGLTLYCIGIALAAMAPGFWWLVPAMAVAAVGNSVFHPVDFTILNGVIRVERLGRAYGLHTLGGNLGWAVAPVLMLSVAAGFGWRAALATAVACGVLVLALVLASWRELEPLETAAERAAARDRPKVGAEVLLSQPIVLCFIYFLLLAVALIMVQNFLPATLEALRGTPLTLAGTALTAFLVGASVGVLLGGFLADRSRRHVLVIALGLGGAAACVAVVGSVPLSPVLLVSALFAAGFLSGMTTPSRDLMVRQATPPGATGRVFGVVYSGLDVGSAFAPTVAGILLDAGRPEMVLWLVAGVLALAIVSAYSVNSVRREPAMPAAAQGD